MVNLDVLLVRIFPPRDLAIPCHILPPGARSHSNSGGSPAILWALYQGLFTYWLLEFIPLSIQMKQEKEFETGPPNHQMAKIETENRIWNSTDAKSV